MELRTTRSITPSCTYSRPPPSPRFEVINRLRVYKTDKEMEVFRYAGKAGAQAHLDAMASCKPGMYEFQLEAMHKVFGTSSPPWLVLRLQQVRQQTLLLRWHLR